MTRTKTKTTKTNPKRKNKRKRSAAQQEGMWLTRRRIRELRRMVHFTLRDLVRFYQGTPEAAKERFKNLSELFCYLSYFVRMNGVEPVVYDVTERYSQFDSKTYGWDRELVVVEWQTFAAEGELFNQSVVPTIGALASAARGKRNVIEDDGRVTQRKSGEAKKAKKSKSRKA